jgi:hypothetical protein
MRDSPPSRPPSPSQAKRPWYSSIPDIVGFLALVLLTFIMIWSFEPTLLRLVATLAFACLVGFVPDAAHGCGVCLIAIVLGTATVMPVVFVVLLGLWQHEADSQLF